MREKLKKHYDQLYLSEKVVFGKGRPTDVVEELLKHTQTGTVLDIGGGEGRNAIFLAQKGFEVEVIDLSKSGIEKIDKKTKKLSLNIKTKVQDITEEHISNYYDVLISSYMLHHLSKNDGLDLIEDMKKHTKNSGFNVISTFTKEGDFFRDKPDTNLFYPALGEIKQLYKDWNILDYKEDERRARQKRPDGSPMFNIASLLIAQKE